MRLYRITKAHYAGDLSGEGSRLYGGRWTPKGHAVIYTAEHPALAAWELVVHFDLPLEIAPLDLRLVTLTVSDEAQAAMPTVTNLPDDPRSIGVEWLTRGASLLLRVPSVMIPQSYNVLINPSHSDMAGVEIADCSAFTFDTRMQADPT